MPRTSRLLSPALLLVALATSPVRADEITITSGVITRGPGMYHSGTVMLVGQPDFSVTGWTSDEVSFGPKVCAPCPAGAEIPLTGYFSGLDFGITSLNGVTNPDVNQLNSWDSLEIWLSGGPVIAPAVVPGGHAVLTGDVTVTGRYRHGAYPFVTDTLLGHGVASLTLDYDPADAWLARDFRLEIAQPAVTPEPSTFVLLATGAAMLFHRVRRRRNGHSS